MAQDQTFSPEPFGPYLLLSHLGRGGMADVYQARLEGVAGFARQVVVKRILSIHTQDPHFVEMFINEAKIASRLSHPNIVQVYDLGEVEGELFMAMEYVRGKDLLRVMRATAAQGHPSPPPNIGAFIVREIARALGHAHDHMDENNAPRPIIHRDISPQNVMIGYDGQVKLVDFGIAKAVTAFNEATHTGSLKGKIGYMAPEQIETGICTPQTDIFSAGVVLHEVLTGRRLFKGNTDYDTLNKVKSAPLLPPSNVNPLVSPDLDKIVMMALDRNPHTRYQRAAQLSRDLDMYLQVQRFSVEDAGAWMQELFSPEERDESEVQGMQKGATPSRSQPRQRTRPGTRPGTSGTPPGPAKLGMASTLQVETPESILALGGAIGSIRVEPRDSASTPAMRPISATLPAAGTPGQTPAPDSRPVSRSAIRSSIRVPVAPPPRRIALPVLVFAGVALLCLSGATVLWILRPGPRSQGSGGPGPPERGSSGAGLTTPPLPQTIALDTDPSGATVYAGPKVMGRTPIQIDLREDSLQVTLSFTGRPDLLYTVRKSDGPKVLLRLPPEVAEVRTTAHHDHHGHHNKHDETASVGQQQPENKGQPMPPPDHQEGKAPPPPPSQVPPPAWPRTPERKKLNVPVLDDVDSTRPGKSSRPID